MAGKPGVVCWRATASSERLIGMNESVCEVAFDGGPEILIHMVLRISVRVDWRGKLRFEFGLGSWEMLACS